jgi:hypothetical protein
MVYGKNSLQNFRVFFVNKESQCYQLGQDCLLSHKTHIIREVIN